MLLAIMNPIIFCLILICALILTPSFSAQASINSSTPATELECKQLKEKMYPKIPQGVTKAARHEIDMYAALAAMEMVGRGCYSQLPPEKVAAAREQYQKSYRVSEALCNQEKLDGGKCTAQDHADTNFAELNKRVESPTKQRPSTPNQSSAEGPTNPSSSSSAIASSNGELINQPAKDNTKGVWPAGMTEGNLYFILDAGYRWNRIPFMVAAKTAREAINRLEQKKMDFDKNGYTRVYPTEFRLVEGGECKGPVWGAVIETHIGSGKDTRQAWGGGCGKTPAQAIKAAFAACKRNGSSACESDRVDGVILALSGSPSASNGYYCMGSCAPRDVATFGFFNAYTRDDLMDRNFSQRFIKSEQDAISMLGKVCANNRPCYMIPGSAKANNFEQDDAYYLEPRLTPNGYKGPLTTRKD